MRHPEERVIIAKWLLVALAISHKCTSPFYTYCHDCQQINKITLIFKSIKIREKMHWKKILWHEESNHYHEMSWQKQQHEQRFLNDILGSFNTYTWNLRESTNYICKRLGKKALIWQFFCEIKWSQKMCFQRRNSKKFCILVLLNFQT